MDFPPLPRRDNGIGALAINLDDETVDLGFETSQVRPRMVAVPAELVDVLPITRGLFEM